MQNTSQVLYIDASTSIQGDQSTANSKIMPHNIVCLNFSIMNPLPNYPYQLKLSIQNENEPLNEIGYTAPHNLFQGQTEIAFNLSFIVDYFFNKVQILKIDIAKGPSQLSVSVPLSQVLTAHYSTLQLPFDQTNPNELVSIIATELHNANKMLELNLNIVNCFENVFFVVNKSKLNLKTNLKEMIAVYKSEMSQNGQFNPMVISSSYLDFGDKTMPIGIDLYIKYNKVGSYETSLNQLLSNECISINIAGYSLFAKAREFERQRKTFLNYLQMKLNMNLYIGIDFTGSNGHYKDEGTLHYINPNNPNQMTLYESAIYECGKILSAYDSDKVYPVYGFGANIIGQQGVSHCFPLTLDPNDNADINGLNNVMIAYRNVLPKLNFSGPTYFEPLLTQIFTTVASMDNKQMNYNIVLLLTDGMINDMQKTVDLIVGSNDLPISLIIVGVGNADFSKMRELDSDGKALKSSYGQVAKRDIVQFVEYNQVGNNPQKLAEKVLEELPKQVEDYFNSKNM